MTEKIEVDGEMVWANPYYSQEPVPDGFDPKWTGEPFRKAKLVKATPAWRIACALGKVPGLERGAGDFVRGITLIGGEDWDRVRANVKIDGEWATYICTRAEVAARKGGQKVDGELEVAP